VTTLRRVANSCLTLTTDEGTTLFDPGFFSWGSDEVDLDAIGDVQRVLVTHTHGDHLEPAFVRWLLDRGDDVTVHGDAAVAAALASHDIEVQADGPRGTSFEDVRHERIPTGDTPPNRAWTIDGVLTHPGDSYQPTASAPVLALPLMTPWGSMTASVEFAKRLQPAAVVPIHDFYLSASGRGFAAGLAARGLADTDIEVLALDWGDSATL
jgi:L-ascorbate metabolism protein UlaG (beta-lactamase superfamily)